MKVNYMVMCIVLMLCVFDTVTGDVTSFIHAIPVEIGNVFSSAWNSISNTIRRHSRIKRLGGGTPKTTTTELTIQTTVTTEVGVTRAFFLSSRNPNFLNHAIPVIPKPSWHSLLHRMGFPEEFTKSKTEIDVADCASEKCNSYGGAVHKKKAAADGYDSAIYRILFFV